MALIILDDASISVGKGPNQGFVLNLQEIKGFPDGLTLMIPFEGQHAMEVYEGIGEALNLNTKIEVADTGTMNREVRRHGVDSSS